WFERDAVAEPFELLDESAGVALCLFDPAVVEEEVAEILVGLVAGEHVVCGDEDRVGDGDRRLAVAAAASESVVLSREVGPLRAAGGLGGFDEGAAQPLGALARLAGFVLTGGLVVAGADPGPGG